MWCKQCRQDVPGVAGVGGRPSCLRCGALLLAETAAAHTIGVAALADHGLELSEAGRARKPATPPPVVEPPPLDWDDDLRWDDVCLPREFAPVLDDRPALLAMEQAAPPLPWAAKLSSPSSSNQGAPASPQQTRRRGPSLAAWAFLSLGLMAFACGLVLLILSFTEGRSTLWGLGLPITVGGQVGLLLGLVLQLERIWQGNRDAVEKLQQVDAQLANLQHTTAMLGTTRGTAAQNFYAHLAGGAPPSMLLADLKSQLDLLAVRMAESRAG